MGGLRPNGVPQDLMITKLITHRDGSSSVRPPKETVTAGLLAYLPSAEGKESGGGEEGEVPGVSGTVSSGSTLWSRRSVVDRGFLG